MLLDLVRQYKREDFPAVAEFVKKQFHAKYILSDEIFFSWQYRLNPCLSEYAFLLLQKEQELYGYIGMVPLDYKVGDAATRLNVYANLFVDERVRGFGLGTLLIKHAMEKGSPAIVSGYNPKTFSIYQKLGDWRALGNFYRYAYMFNPQAAAKLLPPDVPKDIAPPVLPAGYSADSTLSYEPIKTFGASFDEFWQNVRNRYVITVERTSAYLNWRYANHPYLNYEIRAVRAGEVIVGFVVYRVESVGAFSIVRLIDFISQPETEADILYYLIQEVRNRVDMIDFMFSGAQYHSALKKLGFFDVYGTPWERLPIYFNPVSYGKNYINFMAWQKDAAIPDTLFYNSDSWYLTKGDSDQDRPNPHLS